MPFELPSFSGVRTLAEAQIVRERCRNAVALGVRRSEITSSEARTLNDICLRTYERLRRIFRNRNR